MYKDIVNLIFIVGSQNEIGDVVKTKVKSPNIFAEKQSVRQTEFYQAAATGLRPELMFVMRIIDYNQAPLLEFNGKEYKIIRTYEKDNDFIELICQGDVNVVT